MDDEALAERHVDRGADALVLRRGAIAGERIDVGGAFGDGARDAAVEDIDRPADGLARKEQHRRAAQNFDTIGGQRIDRHGMIGRRRRRIDRAEAIDKDRGAFAGEAAQDRARRAG